MIRGGGKRGIRTLGTKKLYNGLAIRRFSPLSHLSPIQKKKNYYAYDTSHKQKEQRVGLEKSLLYILFDID